MISQFENTVCIILSNINELLWGIGTFLFIVLIGLYFTIRIKFCTILHFVKFFNVTFLTRQKSESKFKNGKISRFQGVSTALAASMGTGNIIGVAAAISIGGPGAIFWMWISGIFGTAIGFIENTLGYIFQSHGKGPMGYISYAFHSPRASVLYSLLCVFASFGIGNLTQANALSAAAFELGIPTSISGIIAAALVALLIFNGSKTIASSAEKLVPFAAVLYLLGAFIVIVYYGNYITEVLIMIVKSAFGFDQISGGISAAILKKSVTVGLRRGIFSNEAGLGSSVLVHSEINAKNPVEMGMLSVVEVIIDTLICCTATALVILLSGVDTTTSEGLELITLAFRSTMGDFASFFVASVTIIFAFCTLLGWYFYGEKCLEFSLKTGNSKAVFFYRIFYAVAVYVGSVAQLKVVWEIADILNWVMLVINLSAVLILHNYAVKEINHYTNSIIHKRNSI